MIFVGRRILILADRADRRWVGVLCGAERSSLDRAVPYRVLHQGDWNGGETARLAREERAVAGRARMSSGRYYDLDGLVDTIRSFSFKCARAAPGAEWAGCRLRPHTDGDGRPELALRGGCSPQACAGDSSNTGRRSG
jgi:hypothetical protein